MSKDFYFNPQSINLVMEENTDHPMLYEAHHEKGMLIIVEFSTEGYEIKLHVQPETPELYQAMQDCYESSDEPADYGDIRMDSLMFVMRHGLDWRKHCDIGEN